MAETKSKSSSSSKSETKVVHKVPPKAKSVIEAAKVVVESNGKPTKVVELAAALNDYEKSDTPHNPFGVLIQSPPADEDK